MPSVAGTVAPAVTPEGSFTRTSRLGLIFHLPLRAVLRADSPWLYRSRRDASSSIGLSDTRVTPSLSDECQPSPVMEARRGSVGSSCHTGVGLPSYVLTSPCMTPSEASRDGHTSIRSMMVLAGNIEETASELEAP